MSESAKTWYDSWVPSEGVAWVPLSMNEQVFDVLREVSIGVRGVERSKSTWSDFGSGVCGESHPVLPLFGDEGEDIGLAGDNTMGVPGGNICSF